MKSILVAAKKEFKGYFSSLTAYIYLCVFLTVSNWFFFQTFFLNNQSDMRLFFSLIPWFFLFLVPSITMKLWAEEKGLGTFELLLTLPVKDYELIHGKFFSGWLFLTLSLLLTFNIPLTICLVGKPDIGPIIGGYIGAVLVGGSFIAIGLFSSALTSEQSFASIQAAVGCLFFLVVGNSFITSSQNIGLVVGGWILLILSIVRLTISFNQMALLCLASLILSAVLFLTIKSVPFLYTPLAHLAYTLISRFDYYLRCLNVFYHFDSIARGILDTRDIVYYFSITTFFLYLNKLILNLHHTKKNLSRELAKVGKTTLKAFLLVIILVFTNYLAMNFYYRLDLTQNRKYTLSRSTQKLVQELKEPLYISILFSEKLPPYMSTLKSDIIDLTSDYKSYAPEKIFARIEDPLQNQESEIKANKMGIPKVYLNIFEGDEAQVKPAFLGMALEYGKKTEILPVIQSTQNLEYDITSKIKRLLQEKPITLGVLSGHGEGSMDKEYSRLKENLEKVYAIKEVNFDMGRTLDDVATLLVFGPKQDIKAKDAFLIDQFIMNGGKVIFFLDEYVVNRDIMKAVTLNVESWTQFLKHYGIELDKGIVCDPMCARANFSKISQQFSSSYPFWPKITPPGMDGGPVTSSLPSFVLPWASPINLKTKTPEVHLSLLAKTSPFSIIKNDEPINLTPIKMYNPHTKGGECQRMQRFTLAGILKGRFDSYCKENKELLEKIERSETTHYLSKSTQTEIVAIGTSHVADNETINLFPNNINFTLNLIDYMNIGSDLITIRTRDVEDRPLDKLSTQQKFWIKQANTFGVAFIVIVVASIYKLFNLIP